MAYGKGFDMLARKIRAIGTTVLLLLFFALPVNAVLPDKQEVIDTMILVNDYWIDNNTYGNNQWARATYYEGDMAMFAVYRNQRYYNYALGWAEVRTVGR